LKPSRYPFKASLSIRLPHDESAIKNLLGKVFRPFITFKNRAKKGMARSLHFIIELNKVSFKQIFSRGRVYDSNNRSNWSNGIKNCRFASRRGKENSRLGRSEENLRHFKRARGGNCRRQPGKFVFFDKSVKRMRSGLFADSAQMDTNNIILYYDTLGDVAVQAIQKSGIKKVVFLSSLGAELDSGTGPVVGLHNVEAKLAKLAQTDIVFLRVGAFMENILMNASLIKNQHINGNAILRMHP